MGMAGSDVAKASTPFPLNKAFPLIQFQDASDIVLIDDNIASIVAAIEEGRRIFDNMQKFVLHVLSENVAQAGTLLVGLAFKDRTSFSVFSLALSRLSASSWQHLACPTWVWGLSTPIQISCAAHLNRSSLVSSLQNSLLI